ncbi:MAG: hypothetical protein KAI99_13115 [Cyclobacteriaceae bacterium]|nr:hypothetical protein [Cyclobacteriaceae bacterium]MCK5207423.1 hypothetical protein [Cyclobacteriaceae bacterium]MCK5276977.1 hypothetical protein [Cyclobacteriaceae bacterium]MCK5469454.1 hypothetical protein [Cyclobacteriaceae bacterium]
MKKLMNILMLSCKKASGLIEKKLHFPLSPIEKMQLFFHTSMCDTCKSYQKQSKDLDILLDKHIHHVPNISDTLDNTLSDDIKKRIVGELEKNK